jgi:hypothetical protein
LAGNEITIDHESNLPVTLKSDDASDVELLAIEGSARVTGSADLTKLKLNGATGVAGQLLSTTDGTTLAWINLVDNFEAITLTAPMIAAKEVVLTNTPRSENAPLVWPSGGTPQLVNADYSVDLLNKKIIWGATGATGMDAILSEGMVLVVKYQS